jgi:hypothetical protein
VVSTSFAKQLRLDFQTSGLGAMAQVTLKEMPVTSFRFEAPYRISIDIESCDAHGYFRATGVGNSALLNFFVTIYILDVSSQVGAV